MPKKKRKATDNPKTQHERFKALARDVGANDPKALEKVFGKVIPPRRPSGSGDNRN